MLAADRLVIDGDVVVVGAPELHLGAHEEELLAANGSRQSYQARHFRLLQVARVNLRDVLHHIADADDGGRAPHAD